PVARRRTRTARRGPRPGRRSGAGAPSASVFVACPRRRHALLTPNGVEKISIACHFAPTFEEKLYRSARRPAPLRYTLAPLDEMIVGGPYDASAAPPIRTEPTAWTTARWTTARPPTTTRK